MWLTEKALTPEVTEFLFRAELPLSDYAEDPNEWFLEEFGEDARYELGEAVDLQDPVQYELIWQTEESMRRFFWPLSASTLLSLPHLIGQRVVRGKVVDLGAGMGLTSCFMAWNWPGCHVTAIELTANGVLRGRQIAQRLGIKNIDFINGDMRDIELKGQYDLVTSFLTAHEIGDLEMLESIYGHQAHHDEIAAINLEKYRSGYASFISELLADDGEVFSVERLGDPSMQCAWIGALRNAGVHLDLDRSVFVYPHQWAWGRRERLPVFVASCEMTSISFERFMGWYDRHPFGADVE